MKKFKTNHTNKWIQPVFLLLVIVTIIMAPASNVAAVDEITAAPQQFGPRAYLPLLKNKACSGLRAPDVAFGTQLYGGTDAGQRHFDLFHNTGTPWLRNSIYWVQIEPTNRPPSQFEWGAADAHLMAAKDHCVNMIGTIEGIPAWAATNGDRSPIKPQNIADFVQFMTAVVDRYDGDGKNDNPHGIVVHHWEIFNEPDFGSNDPKNEGYGEYGELYAQLLEAIYAPMHAENEQVKVVFGGVAHNLFSTFVREFIDDAMAAGAGPYFDVMNFHYYPFQHNREMWTDTNSSGLREKYEEIKGILEANGVTNKPFFITELGWHASTTNPAYPSNPEFQARRVVELLTQARSLGSEVTIWWTFFDELQVFPYETGLTTDDQIPSARPSYTAYVEVLKRLGKSTYVAATSLPSENNDLEAYEFRDNLTNKTFYVAWLNPTVYVHQDAVSDFDDNVTEELNVPGARATIFDKLGEQVQVINDGDDGKGDGKVTVTVGRSPIYIVID